eukprot:CAMPEP_0170092308 /NCGR_PEP_ID=MMETSP0019_2-20121128/25690_1 /TAXON_ID=98059 /ORGANISM="Dinobryon sp., Strain UTEXLB2267" /LENGTH=174 /DNA_ID=CAMNT_0010312637 /DNA_START=52 /DNA_END=576 /DNA_ORIENTATION=-
MYLSKSSLKFSIKSSKTKFPAPTINFLIQVPVATLVTDLDPNAFVKASMNDIIAQARLREAASEKADAEKILLVKAAEAEAESKYLSGLGVAKQRKAIVDGLRDTINGFSNEVDNSSPQDVMDLLLLTQYFDMIKDIGVRNKSGSTLFLPHGPQSVRHLRTELAKSFVGKSNKE